MQAEATRIVIADTTQNQLDHAASKLGDFSEQVDFIEDNATASKQKHGSVDAGVTFYLLHELPHHLKGQTLSETARILAPDGKHYVAEFHRPDLRVLRALSRIYFKIFAALGMALWGTHHPVDYLQNMGLWKCARSIYFFGNFQVITATKPLPDGYLF